MQIVIIDFLADLLVKLADEHRHLMASQDQISQAPTGVWTKRSMGKGRRNRFYGSNIAYEMNLPVKVEDLWDAVYLTPQNIKKMIRKAISRCKVKKVKEVCPRKQGNCIVN